MILINLGKYSKKSFSSIITSLWLVPKKLEDILASSNSLTSESKEYPAVNESKPVSPET
jgi:hypothetical protein